MDTGSINAGLPNITGSINSRCTFAREINGSSGPPNYSGALYNYKDYGNLMDEHTGIYRYTWAPGFDASRSNTIYGKSSTVTPLSTSSKFYLKF